MLINCNLLVTDFKGMLYHTCNGTVMMDFRERIFSTIFIRPFVCCRDKNLTVTIQMICDSSPVANDTLVPSGGDGGDNWVSNQLTYLQVDQFFSY